MSLIHRKSKKAAQFDEKEDMSADQPQKQALAISYSIQRKNKKKKMADGGIVERGEGPEATEEPMVPMRKKDDERLPVDEYMAGHFAKGGAVDLDEHLADEDHMEDMDEFDKEHRVKAYKGGEMDMEYSREPKSIADAIMHRRMMAAGGQVDLSENAEEEPNNEDQMSFDALKKENYSESDGLDQIDQPMDSNEHGHEMSDEDAHDMIDHIRRKIMSKRGR